MIKNLNVKTFLLAIIYSLTLTSCGDNSKEEVLDDTNIIITEEIETKEETNSITETIEEISEEESIVGEEEIIRSINDINRNTYLTTISKVNLRKENSTESEILEVLPVGVKFNEYELIDDWYLVNYNSTYAYINSDYAKEKDIIEFPYEFKKVVYLTKDKTIYSNQSLTATEITLKELECCEVYEEFENSYLIKTNDIAGYISKDDTEELTDTFVVVDISEQELKLYEDNKVILTSPVVTGKPKTPSTQGMFEIYDISHNRYLVGPGYKSYVDIMMKYHNGEGLHDAEYHTDSNGFKHGWRNRSEFGGETYIKNGSHGCVNMPHDEVMEVEKHVNLGTKVLVKE